VIKLPVTEKPTAVTSPGHPGPDQRIGHRQSEIAPGQRVINLDRRRSGSEIILNCRRNGRATAADLESSIGPRQEIAAEGRQK